MELTKWKRRFSERLDDRLLARPVMFVLLGVGLSQITLAIDRNLGDDALPAILETSVDSANSILSTIAGGLISAITLLLSLVLVTVQLASSQFSPRTLRDWIGDETQQRTIGIVLGTTVYCLLVLRESRSLGDSLTLAPHISVLVAVALAVVSLVAVVRSVDHLSYNMRIGSVARNIADETLGALRALGDNADLSADPTPGDPRPSVEDMPALQDGSPMTAPTSGWIEQVDLESLTDMLPADAHMSLVVGPGAFVYEGQPLAWFADEANVPDRIDAPVIAIGDTRLVAHDVSFGLLQMSDIALRAISPGINDPNTAVDVVAHMGIVLLEAWSIPPSPSRLHLDNNVTVDVVAASHADYLDTAFSQILRYAPNEFAVLTALKRTLDTIISEVVRRGLPGPLEPLQQMRNEILETVQRSDLTQRDKSRFT